MAGSNPTGAIPPHGSLRRRLAAESETADRLLGRSHPLVRALRASQTACEQLLVLTVVEASAVGMLAGGGAVGLRVLIAAVVVQLGILLWLLAMRSCVQAECRELIIDGGAPAALATVDRERQRLADPRHRDRLARSIEDLLAAATAVDPGAPRHLDLHLVERVAPDLREIVTLLRAGTTDVVGVARVERLMTEAGSPLYGAHERVLRQELARIRHRLVCAANGCGVSPIERGGLRG
jgi:hypothetical protein